MKKLIFIPILLLLLLIAGCVDGENIVEEVVEYKDKVNYPLEKNLQVGDEMAELPDSQAVYFAGFISEDRYALVVEHEARTGYGLTTDRATYYYHVNQKKFNIPKFSLTVEVKDFDHEKNTLTVILDNK